MVWKLVPSRHVETAKDAILTPESEATPVDTSAPIETSVPPTPAQDNPAAVQSPEAKMLEDAIRSGDRYRVASALASMGIKTDDELLSHILLPPFGEEPARQ